MLPAQFLKRLAKKAKRGFRGYPLGTVAFYGPDSTRASKVAASIIPGEGQEPAEVRRWHSDSADLRADPGAAEEVLAFFEEFGVISVAMVNDIIGCPHEEGVDYEGETCPQCPYWAGRDRWTGRRLT